MQVVYNLISTLLLQKQKNQCGNLTSDFEKKPVILFKVEDRMQSYFYYYSFTTFDPKNTI